MPSYRIMSTPTNSIRLSQAVHPTRSSPDDGPLVQTNVTGRRVYVYSRILDAPKGFSQSISQYILPSSPITVKRSLLEITYKSPINNPSPLPHRPKTIQNINPKRETGALGYLRLSPRAFKLYYVLGSLPERNSRGLRIRWPNIGHDPQALTPSSLGNTRVRRTL